MDIDIMEIIQLLKELLKLVKIIVLLDVVFPKREIKGFYLIFDYYINDEDLILILP